LRLIMVIHEDGLSFSILNDNEVKLLHFIRSTTK
jgi:hypothetical protein